MILPINRVRQFYAWHKWTGLIVGLFLLIINLSGAIAVFKNDLDRLLTPAKVVRPGTAKASLDTVLENAKRAHAGTRIIGIVMPDHPDAAYVIDAVSEKRQRIEIFADPYTGSITGSRQGEHFANVLRQLHLRFYFFGFWGRVVVGVLGVVFLVSTITGLLIYWRFMRGVFSRGMHFWQIRKGFQLSTSDWHKLVGIGAVVFNLILAFTGAFLGLENLTRYTPRVQEALQPRPRTLVRTNAIRKSGAPRFKAGVDQSIRAAESAVPGFHANTINFPGGDYTLIYGKRSGSFARDRASFVVVNAAGEVVESFDQSRGTTTSRLYNLIEPLHYGSFGGSGWGGTLVRSLYLALGLGSAFLSITGFLLWWLKWRKRRGSPRQRAPVRLPHAATL